MICYFIFGILLTIFGIICYLEADKNKDFEIQYDDKCTELNTPCTFQFTLPHDLVNPKLYYKLENFYANHRNFVKSRDYKYPISIF